MNHKEYNGWYNYETWLTKLWIDNEPGTYDTVTEHARLHAYGSEGSEKRLRGFERWLKDWVEQLVFEKLEGEAGLANDLLNAALMEVNFSEIAASYMDDAEQYREEYKEHRKGF